MAGYWLDGNKGWILDFDDLASVTDASRKICEEVGVEFDPASVLLFADYEGNLRIGLKGVRWRFDEQKGRFEARGESNA